MITRPDHVDAVVAAIDAVELAGDEIVLVGHCARGALAHAAVDARPVRLGRAILAGIERQ
jgi:poly(3-hydroxyalkanoate) synthetase